MRWRALCLAAIVIALQFCVWAEPIAQLKPTGYVNDFAHVLNPSTTQQIEDLCRQVDEKAHAQIALVTINTLDGNNLESYSIDLAQKWGMGPKGKDRGVLILYVIQDHKYRVEVGYGLEPILPDGKVGGFGREAVPLMRSGNYNQALLLVTTRVADVIAQDAGVQLTHAQPPEPVQPERYERPSGGITLGGIILIIIVILLVLFTPLRTLLFWMLFSNIFGGRGGGFGGGGFGGFGGGGGGFGGGGSGGGGGGFGGFGGGSFGGGGASGSW